MLEEGDAPGVANLVFDEANRSEGTPRRGDGVGSAHAAPDQVVGFLRDMQLDLALHRILGPATAKD